MEIYVLINEQPQGPYTPDMIREGLKTGELQSTQLAALAGSADWIPLSVMMQSWGPAAAAGTRYGGPAAKPNKPGKKLLGPIVVGTLLLIAGAAGVFWWRFFGDSGPVIKVTTPVEPGFPNTLAELNTWYVEPPAGQNAATFFLQGFDALQITEADRASLPVVGQSALPPLGSPLPPKVKAGIAALSQRNKAAWENFQKGAQCEQSRYPLDLNKGYDTLLPHLTKLKQTLHAGELTAVLLVSLAEAQSLKQEPVFISQLVRVAGVTIATETLERVLNSAALPSADLSRLAGAFAKAEAGESAGTGFTRACGGERASVLATFDLPPDRLAETLKNLSGAKPAESGGALQNLALKKVTRNLKSQRAFAEETFNRALVLRQQPFPGRLATKDYFNTRMAEAKTNDFELCLLLLPALANQTLKEAGGLAELRLAQTAIALEQFRAPNGDHYPAGLAELAAQLATASNDPFDGQPLRYHKTATGYQLYSIGADLKDDGGQRESAGKGDLVFEIVKAPKAVPQSGGAIRN